MIKKFFSSLFKKWQIMSWPQKGLVVFFIFILLIGIYSLINIAVNKITITVPVNGGTLRLGIVEHPSFLNPVLSANNEGDREIANLIYSGLFKVQDGGKILPDLAEKVEISPDGKTYTVFLKKNVYWHDGVPFTADDVIFTIETIQDSEMKSPLYSNWQGVVAEKLSSNIVRFNLRNPYTPFLQNLTIKIIPRHIWEGITALNFPHAEYNFKPIGTGPYVFESLEKLKTGKIVIYNLVANKNYYKKPPYISHLVLRFYDNYEEGKRALLRGEVDGLDSVSVEEASFFTEKRKYKLIRLLSPRYYAVFLNLKKSLFTPDVRKAMDLAIDRKRLVEDVLHQEAIALDSPFTPEIFSGITKSSDLYKNSLEKAKEIINQQKGKPKELKFQFFVPQNKTLVNVANFLVKSWQQIGLKPELHIVPSSVLTEEIIEARDYEAVLFGEMIGVMPDLFAFWHSSQVESPGLNLSEYSNKELDGLIEELRTTIEETRRQQLFEKIQNILDKDKPAIFLYNSYYLFVLPRQVQGNNISVVNFPSEKFNDIENWFLRTKRELNF